MVLPVGWEDSVKTAVGLENILAMRGLNPLSYCYPLGEKHIL